MISVVYCRLSGHNVDDRLSRTDVYYYILRSYMCVCVYVFYIEISATSDTPCQSVSSA